MTANDRRLSRAQLLEQQAKKMRDEVESDIQNRAPKVGDRIVALVPAYQTLNPRLRAPKVEREATVRAVHSGQHELCIDFDDWNHCESCGQRTNRKWDRIKFKDVMAICK